MKYALGLFAGSLTSFSALLFLSSTQGQLIHIFVVALIASCLIVAVQVFALADLLGDSICESSFKFSFLLGFVAQAITLVILYAVTFYALSHIARIFNMSSDTKLLLYTLVPLLAVVLVPTEIMIIKTKLYKVP